MEMDDDLLSLILEEGIIETEEMTRANKRLLSGLAKGKTLKLSTPLGRAQFRYATSEEEFAKLRAKYFANYR